jgi:outer membrane receptor protein involved in Fe transport
MAVSYREIEGDGLMSDSTASRIIGLAALVASATIVMPDAAAQSADNKNVGAIPQVIVTAQKREQDLQDVPITVTAVGSQLLRDTGVRDIKDLTLLTPGLIVTSTSNEASTTARIRGIGTVGDNAGLESSVGVVIDGVYRPRNGVGFGDLGELERVEVLKGPQGTLFGKNTSAGVINIITQRPQFQFGSNLELTAGNLGELDGAASITGPLVGDKLAGRLYVVKRTRDGLYDVNTGGGPRSDDEDADRDVLAVRGQLLLRQSENFEARLIADYARREENCCAATQINVGGSAPLIDALATDSGVANPADPFARRAFADRSTEQSIRDKGVALDFNWDLPVGTLTSISAWRDWDNLNGQDSDYSTADILYRPPGGPFSNKFKQLSQELRLAGETGRVNWLIGAFYAAEDLDSSLDLRYGTDFETYYSLALSAGRAPTLVNALTGRPVGTAYPAGAGYRDTFNQDSDTFALFTNDDIAITDKLDLTLGLRYTNEQKDLDSFYTNSDGGAGCAASRARFAAVAATLPAAAVPSYYAFGCATFADPIYNNLATSQSIDESKWSGTVKLAYRFTPNLMSYVSFARGYKASGYNLDRERTPIVPAPGAPPGPPLFTADTDTSFRPEVVDSYELGVKTSTPGRSLLLNTSLFYQKFEDFQLNTFTGISFVVVSIPEVTSKGVDLDFVWAPPVEHLAFNGGLTYAETTYGNFTPPFAALFRLPNNQMSFAPRWSGSLSATYEQPIGGSLLWRANAGAKHTSRYNTGSDLNPAKLQGAVTLVNARLGIGSQNKRWMLEAWAQNLTNQEYYQVVFDATLQTGTLDAYLGAPRTYGLTLRAQF